MLKKCSGTRNAAQFGLELGGNNPVTCTLIIDGSWIESICELFGSLGGDHFHPQPHTAPVALKSYLQRRVSWELIPIKGGVECKNLFYRKCFDQVHQVKNLGTGEFSPRGGPTRMIITWTTELFLHINYANVTQGLNSGTPTSLCSDWPHP